MSNLVLLEVVVEGYKVETQLLGDDIYRSTAGQRRIQIHHTCVETIAGVGCHVMFRFQTVVTLIPMAEADEIAVHQLTALWHTCRTRGVEEDEQIIRRNRSIRSIRIIRKILDFSCQQHLTLVFVHDGSQLLVSNEQLGIRILHHEVKTLLWVRGVKGLVGTSCLQHAQ